MKLKLGENVLFCVKSDHPDVLSRGVLMCICSCYQSRTKTCQKMGRGEIFKHVLHVMPSAFITLKI